MQKKIRMLTALAIVGLIAGIAFAGQVYGRAVKTLSVTAGSGTWTNSSLYAAIELKRIWSDFNRSAANTVTVTRVTSDNTYTGAVGSIVTAAGVGSTASFTAAYLQDGDKLVFASTIATGSTVIIEYEVQKH
jgi:hypothetical protein